MGGQGGLAAVLNLVFFGIQEDYCRAGIKPKFDSNVALRRRENGKGEV